MDSGSTQWFVEPRNENTNALICSMDGLAIAEEDCYHRTRCSDGCLRNLLLIKGGWDDIRRLIHDEKKLKLDIKVFKRIGSNGPICEENFLVKKEREKLRNATRKKTSSNAITGTTVTPK